jgi:hypothetical protein
VQWSRDPLSETLVQPNNRKESGVGAVVMLGTLLGLIALFFCLVFYFDPEARGARETEDDLS